MTDITGIAPAARPELHQPVDPRPIRYGSQPLDGLSLRATLLEPSPLPAPTRKARSRLAPRARARTGCWLEISIVQQLQSWLSPISRPAPSYHARRVFRTAKEISA